MAWGQNKLEARHPENEKHTHAVFEKNGLNDLPTS